MTDLPEEAVDIHDWSSVEKHADQLAESYDDFGRHAAMVDILFCPPESYDDAHSQKLHEVWEYVNGQPCTCTQPAVDLEGACPRCRLLNQEFGEYVGSGR